MMANLMIFIVFILGVSIGIIRLNKMGLRYKLVAKVLATFIVLFFVYNIFIGSGFGFRSYSSARANAFIIKEHEWLGLIEVDDGHELHVFFDPTEDEYMTVYVEKRVVGYSSSMSTHLYPHHEDSIRTIGTMNMADDGRTYSGFMVEVEDAKVKTLAIIDEDDNILISEKISSSYPITIAYEYSGRQTCFNCELVAMDEDGVALFYYGYEHGDNYLSDKEYKWYAY